MTKQCKKKRCSFQFTGGCSKDPSIIGLDKRAEFNQDLCPSFADKYHGPSQKQEQLDNKWLQCHFEDNTIVPEKIFLCGQAIVFAGILVDWENEINKTTEVTFFWHCIG